MNFFKNGNSNGLLKYHRDIVIGTKLTCGFMKYDIVMSKNKKKISQHKLKCLSVRCIEIFSFEEILYLGFNIVSFESLRVHILLKNPCFFMIFLTKHMRNNGSKLAYHYFWMKPKEMNVRWII
jgi:hypothetical protein